MEGDSADDVQDVATLLVVVLILADIEDDDESDGEASYNQDVQEDEHLLVESWLGTTKTEKQIS